MSPPVRVAVRHSIPHNPDSRKRQNPPDALKRWVQPSFAGRAKSYIAAVPFAPGAFPRLSPVVPPVLHSRPPDRSKRPRKQPLRAVLTAGDGESLDPRCQDRSERPSEGQKKKSDRPRRPAPFGPSQSERSKRPASCDRPLSAPGGTGLLRGWPFAARPCTPRARGRTGSLASCPRSKRQLSAAGRKQMQPPTCCHSLPLPPIASGCSVSGCRSYPEFGPPRTPCGCGARPHGLARGLQRLPLLLRVRCFGWWLVLSTVGSFVCVPVLLAAAGCGWPRAAGLLPLLVLVLVWLLLSLRGWPSPPRLLVVPLSLLVFLPWRCGAPLGRSWWRGVPPALRRSSARGGWPLLSWWLLLLVCCMLLLWAAERGTPPERSTVRLPGQILPSSCRQGYSSDAASWRRHGLLIQARNRQKPPENGPNRHQNVTKSPCTILQKWRELPPDQLRQGAKKCRMPSSSCTVKGYSCP